MYTLTIYTDWKRTVFHSDIANTWANAFLGREIQAQHAWIVQLPCWYYWSSIFNSLCVSTCTRMHTWLNLTFEEFQFPTVSISGYDHSKSLIAMGTACLNMPDSQRYWLSTQSQQISKAGWYVQRQSETEADKFCTHLNIIAFGTTSLSHSQTEVMSPRPGQI